MRKEREQRAPFQGSQKSEPMTFNGNDCNVVNRVLKLSCCVSHKILYSRLKASFGELMDVKSTFGRILNEMILLKHSRTKRQTIDLLCDKNNSIFQRIAFCGWKLVYNQRMLRKCMAEFVNSKLLLSVHQTFKAWQQYTSDRIIDRSEDAHKTILKNNTAVAQCELGLLSPKKEQRLESLNLLREQRARADSVIEQLEEKACMKRKEVNLQRHNLSDYVEKCQDRLQYLEAELHQLKQIEETQAVCVEYYEQYIFEKISELEVVKDWSEGSGNCKKKKKKGFKTQTNMYSGRNPCENNTTDSTNDEADNEKTKV